MLICFCSIEHRLIQIQYLISFLVAKIKVSNQGAVCLLWRCLMRQNQEARERVKCRLLGVCNLEYNEIAPTGVVCVLVPPVNVGSFIAKVVSGGYLLADHAT